MWSTNERPKVGLFFRQVFGTAAMIRRRRSRGSAVVELSLLAPWIFFLFVGALDMGFYSYSLIAVENAVRVAGEYTASSSTVAADSSGACTRALNELAMVANLGNPSNCNAAPVIVTAQSVTGPDSKPASQVSITYRSSNLIPIPGLLTGSLNITRTVQMRVQP